jgi:hypothetical protein
MCVFLFLFLLLLILLHLANGLLILYMSKLLLYMHVVIMLRFVETLFSWPNVTKGAKFYLQFYV